MQFRPSRKPLKYLGITLFSIVISGCGDSETSDESYINAPKFLDQIEFEDEFIRNCAYKMKEEFDATSGQWVFKHTLVDQDGVYYANTSEIPSSAVTELVDCKAYNRTDNNISNTTPKPTGANHLRDLAKLPSLKHVTLDFNVQSFVDLAQATQVEQLTLRFLNSQSSENVVSEVDIPLSLVGEMSGLDSLVVYGSLYSDWSGLQSLTQISHLSLASFNNAFNGAEYVPNNVKSFGLFETDFATSSDLKYLTQVEHLSVYRFLNQEMAEVDFGYLADFSNLKRVNISHNDFKDLSVITNDEVEELHLNMVEADFDDTDLEVMKSMLKLRALSVSFARSNKVDFRVGYNDFSDPNAVIPIDEPIDSSFLERTVTNAQYEFLQQYYDVTLMEDYGEQVQIRIKDLTANDIVTLFEMWYLGYLS